jgi:hypothetical protein
MISIFDLDHLSPLDDRAMARDGTWMPLPEGDFGSWTHNGGRGDRVRLLQRLYRQPDDVLTYSNTSVRRRTDAAALP